MQIDNKERASKIKLINMLIPLLVVIAMGILYLVTEIRDIKYAVIAVLLLISYFVIMAKIKPTFLSVFIGPDIMRFRFKSLSPFNTSNNTIQLKPAQFNRFEFKKVFFGLNKQIILYINSPSGLAKYPPISVSAVKATEIEKITKALQLIMAMNKAAKQNPIDSSK